VLGIATNMELGMMRKVKTSAQLLVLLISIYEMRPSASIANLQEVTLPSEIWRQKFDRKIENEPRLKGFANALWNHIGCGKMSIFLMLRSMQTLPRHTNC